MSLASGTDLCLGLVGRVNLLKRADQIHDAQLAVLSPIELVGQRSFGLLGGHPLWQDTATAWPM